MKPLANAEARAVACPQCGARPGQACAAPNGNSGRPHRARTEAVDPRITELDLQLAQAALNAPRTDK